MQEFRIGNVYAREQVFEGPDPSPEIETSAARLYPQALVIHSADSSEAHFCVKQTLDYDERSLTTEVHFDWHLGHVELGKDVPGRRFPVFRPHENQFQYLGQGHVGMCHFGGSDGAKIQADILDATPDLAAILDHEPDRPPLDGIALSAALRTKGADLLQVAEDFATSWLGPLPEAEVPEFSARAPAEVQRWHALWARLAKIEQYPFCCWPAIWAPAGKNDILYFQNEWQNGGTFGYRAGEVWIDGWATGGEDLLCAESMGEFAVQFILFGLTEGSKGKFVTSKKPIPGLVELPINPWLSFLFSESIEFVGGYGMVGMSSQDGTILCVTPDRFGSLYRSL